MAKLMLKNERERIESVFLRYPEGILVRVYSRDWKEAGAWNCIVPAKGLEEIDLALEEIERKLKKYAKEA